MKKQYHSRASNHIKCAIIGFPNVGKSTLFNSFNGERIVDNDNFIFCTMDTTSCTIPVNDFRLDWLRSQFSVSNVKNAQITIIDTPSIVQNSYSGEGVGLKFLDEIRDVDVFLHVLRGFTDDSITHYDETIDPVRDMNITNHEIMLADLERVESAIQSIEPVIRNMEGGIEAKLERETLIEAWDYLSGLTRPFTLFSEEDPMKAGPKPAYLKKASKPKAIPSVVLPSVCQGLPLRLKQWTSRQIDLLEKYKFLSAKPVIFMVNVSVRDYLRSLSSSANPSGRENFRVRAVIDEVYAYEYKASGAIREACSLDSSSASDTASETPKQRFEGEPVDNSNIVVGSVSKFSTTSDKLFDGPPDEEDLDSLPHGDNADSVFKPFPGTLKIGDIDENASIGVSEFRSSLVLCCSLKFEEMLAEKCSRVDRDNSELLEYQVCNPSHKSVLLNCVDSLYRTLGLIRYYTLDIRASAAAVWLVRRGSTLPQAAAVVHLNMSRAFVRGDIVNYDDLWSYYTNCEAQGQPVEVGMPGLVGALDALRLEGLARSQGVKYIVNDGDIIEFVSHSHGIGFA